PESCSTLTRPVSPETIVTAEGAIPAARARSLTRAVLARPFSGAARTLAASTTRPSASARDPSMASQAAFGVSRTATRKLSPPLSSQPGTASAPVQKADQEALDDDEDDDQDD